MTNALLKPEILEEIISANRMSSKSNRNGNYETEMESAGIRVLFAIERKIKFIIRRKL